MILLIIVIIIVVNTILLLLIVVIIIIMIAIIVNIIVIVMILLPPAFLYQEYRDTSKQQEIEQRRQRDGLTPAGPAGATSPPALQLQLRNNSRSLSLWQNLEVVQHSGLLEQLPQREIIMQEVRAKAEGRTRGRAGRSRGEREGQVGQ